ncbi:isoprenylcysteine carboxyl methyltransferase family protein [Solibacillus sp. R5-41]|uniref:isoprenylcysteine carboxyl methyltransferase family protein n=1 Tax=Solibacillus sp. R5-41 TaxID=2048654 RepID=UPI0020A52270|nr:isoprenylcysteine carboxylmethyltransferase family protein [Solibacillus sp. R5-41]
MVFAIIIILIILQRLVELVVAKRNEKTMRAKGAYEVGASHYPYMIMLHSSFFVSLIIEVMYGNAIQTPDYLLLIVFLGLQLMRIWCLMSLGSFWNTKILILPGATLVKKGPYAFIPHPNYVIVCLEILVIPLMFQAYFTALCFTILNAWMLTVRIPIEGKALKEATKSL